jgi:hypothetical protein
MTMSSSYVPPEIVEVSSAQLGPVVIKKKTKKAFVPGAGVRDHAPRSYSEASDREMTRSTTEIETVTHTSPAEEVGVIGELTSPPEDTTESQKHTNSVEETREGEVHRRAAEETVEVETGPSLAEARENIETNTYTAEERGEILAPSYQTEETGEPEHPADPTGTRLNKEDVTADKEQNPLSNESEITAVFSCESLVSRERELRESKAQICAEIAALVSEQSRLCENEAFDEAELLEAQIQEKRESLFEVVYDLGSVLPQEMEKLKLEQLEREERMLTTLRSQIATEEEKTRLFRESTSQRIAELRERLAVVIKVDEKFNQQQLDIDSRKVEISNKRSEIDSLIDDQCAEISAEKTAAEQRYEELDALIEDLQKQLAQAMEQRSECARTISGNELKLRTVQVQFADQLEELEFEESTVNELVDELKAMKEAEGGGDAAALGADLMELEQLEEASEQEGKEKLKNLSSLLQDLEKFNQVRIAFEEEKEKILCHVYTLRRQLVESSEYTKLISDQLRTAESSVEVFKKKVAEMKERLPILEAEKKDAIASRDFKGAKELASEISEMMAEIDNADTRLSALRSGVKSGRAELGVARQLEETLEKELEEAEKSSDEIFSHLIQKTIKPIDDILESVESESIRQSFLSFKECM